MLYMVGLNSLSPSTQMYLREILIRWKEGEFEINAGTGANHISERVSKRLNILADSLLEEEPQKPRISKAALDVVLNSLSTGTIRQTQNLLERRLEVVE